MDFKKNILIVETSQGHYELLFSFKKALETQFHVSFAIQNPLHFQDQGLNQEEALVLSGSRWQQINQISEYCKKKSIETVVFNTAAGSLVFWMSFRLKLMGLQLFGVLHNAYKLESVGSLTLLRQFFSGFIFLNENIHKRWAAKALPQKSTYFYPCYFKKSAQGHSSKDSQLRIGVIGQVEKKRKDLDSLVITAQTLKEKNRNDFCFQIIGNSSTREGQEFKHHISNLGLENYFQFYNKRLSQDEMMAEIEKCDLVAPLIHPETDYAQYYIDSKISGAINLALGFHKPLLIHSFLPQEEFKNWSIFYGERNLSNILIELQNRRDVLTTVVQTLKADSRIHLQNQALRLNQLFI